MPPHDQPKRIGDPDRRRRRPGPQRGHQERRLPRDRGRLRGPRHPPRLGGPDPPPARRRRDPDYLRPLDRINTRTIDRTGGTILHTSRTNPRKMRAAGLPAWMDASSAPRYAVGDDRLRPDAARPRQHQRAGHRRPGDDRRRRHAVATRGSSSNAGVPLVAIPKTMDNDVQGTEYCIGFSTAITRAKEAINRQRTTLGVARADRRLPDLRPGRRVLRAVHRIRDIGAVRDPGGALRPRRARRRSSRRTTPRTRATTPS